MTNSDPVKPGRGLFIVKGDRIDISSFSISIDAEGTKIIGPVVLQSGINMTHFWLDVAYQHLKAAESAHKKLMRANEIGDDSLIGQCLKLESRAGMQCIMASGVALDAYYASLKEYVKIPKDTVEAWQRNGTARYKQIGEVIRLAFGLSNSISKNLREVLKQNITLRDQAVHPFAGTTKPAVHVELNKTTDWRYATFRYSNAKMVYGLSLSVVYKTASISSGNKSSKLKGYCEGLIEKIDPLRKKWVRKFGKLL